MIYRIYRLFKPDLMLLSFLYVLMTFSVALADGRDDARTLAKMFVNEANYAAALTASRPQIELEIRKSIDFSNISKSDFNEYFELLVQKMEEAMIAGLRKAFEKRMVDDMPEEDIAQLLRCHQGAECTEASFSADGLKIVRDFPRFGQEQGQRIGTMVGVIIAPDLISIIEANVGGTFENPEALVKALRSSVQ